MKKLLILALAAILASCAVQYQEKRYILDYRPYVEQGFTLTPSTTITAPHDCLASIILEVIPGQTATSVRVSDGAGNMITKRLYSKERKGDSVDEALESFVSYAKEIGANGAIGLQSRTKIVGGLTVYELSGVAVNIK